MCSGTPPYGHPRNNITEELRLNLTSALGGLNFGVLLSIFYLCQVVIMVISGCISRPYTIISVNYTFQTGSSMDMFCILYIMYIHWVLRTYQYVPHIFISSFK